MSDKAIPTAVPRPARCRTRVEELGGQLELHSRQFSSRQLGITAFLALWLTGWSAGCGFLVVGVAGEPSLENVLFAIPFVAAWFAVSGILVSLVFGRQLLRIDPQGLTYEFRAIAPLARRHIPLEEVKRAVVATGGVDSESRRSSACMQIETTGRPVEFGCDLDDDELHWLVQRVNEQLDAVRPKRKLFHEPADSESAVAEPQRSATGAEILVAARPPLPEPSDCRFVLSDDFEVMRFVSAGRWSLAAIGGVTFLNLFWNGVVSVFVLQLLRNFEWSLFFFLIPFEGMGLLFFCAWVLALAAPAYRERWSFARNEFSHRPSFFGVGWTRRYPIEPLDRIELQEDSAPAGATTAPALADMSDSGGAFRLSFISRDQEIAYQIKNLTEGEARWMADRILRARPKWFWRAHRR